MCSSDLPQHSIASHFRLLRFLRPKMPQSVRVFCGPKAMGRSPIRAGYRGHTVLSMPPSSSGGVTLAEALHMLEGFAIGDMEWHSPEHVHLLAEVWRRAYADRNRYLADPAFVKMPIETLTSRAYAAWRARDIDLSAATDRKSTRLNSSH